jgi:flagellar protein FlgJ
MGMTAQADGAARHARLLHSAQEFEAIMLEVILKPLGKSGAIDGDEDSQGSTGPLQSFGVEAVAGAMAKSDALGFAARITESVEKHDPKPRLEKQSPDPKVPPVVADGRRGGSST